MKSNLNTLNTPGLRGTVLSCPDTPASGLQLLLEESSSLVPETPITPLLELTRKELDASRLYSLQKSNGFNFKVVDKSMVSRLAVLEDIKVAKDATRGGKRGDQ